MMMTTISAIVLGIILVLWLTLLVLLLRAVWLAVKSRQWPQTNGKITNSRKEATGHRYRVLLQYEYTVNGYRYTSHILSFIDLFVLFFMNGERSKRAANHVTAKYPVNAEVTVHYDPKNPKRAVLETEIWNGNVAIIATILAIMGGIFLLGLGLR
jgi:hypothetical protein